MDIVKSPLLTEKIDTGSCGSNNPAKFPEKTGVVRVQGLWAISCLKAEGDRPTNEASFLVPPNSPSQ